MRASGDGPRVAVVDYGIGNLHSAQKALTHVGADTALTADPAQIAAADAVVLPGVGAFGACMRALRTSGLEGPVLDAATSGQPFLGICVGMQMLFSASDEDPETPGLAVIAGSVRTIAGDVKLPQMQWNQVTSVPEEPLFAGLGPAPWFYFVHSLHGVPDDPRAVVGTCEYGGTVNAAFRVDAVTAVQFHPEKSSTAGLGLLANFVATIEP